MSVSWTKKDDSELQKCYDRLRKKEIDLQSQLGPISKIVTNVKQIQTRESVSYNDKKEKITTKIIPKDQWGKDMTDEYRLKTKEECITRTNKLLGEADE